MTRNRQLDTYAAAIAAADPASLPPLGRVQLAAYTDAWMAGDRYASVLKRLPRDRLLLQLDRSGRRIRIAAKHTTPIA